MKNATILFHEMDVHTSNGKPSFRGRFLRSLIGVVIFGTLFFLVGADISSAIVFSLVLLFAFLLSIASVLSILQMDYLIVTDETIALNERRFKDFILHRHTVLPFREIETVYRITNSLAKSQNLYQIKLQGQNKLFTIRNSWGIFVPPPVYKKSVEGRVEELDAACDCFTDIFERKCTVFEIPIVDTERQRKV